MTNWVTCLVVQEVYVQSHSASANGDFELSPYGSQPISVCAQIHSKKSHTTRPNSRISPSVSTSFPFLSAQEGSFSSGSGVM